MNNVISITNGVARHPERRMAEPVTLTIGRGEQVAIVGNNAAGKSRLVDIITGRSPLLGDGAHYDFGPGAHRLVSDNLKYVAFRDSYGEQDGTYYHQQRWNQHDIGDDWATVGSLLAGAPDHLMRLFHLDALRPKPIVTLSSGEMRKLQLTRTLAAEPRMIVVDNPFIGLDAPTRQQLRELLETLVRDAGLQLILVLPAAGEIPDFITHVLPVTDLRLGRKMTREEFLARKPITHTPALPGEEHEWILNLAAKDITAIPFYPQQGGEILKFNGVSVRYGERTILRDLHWTVHEGERWALSGENGAGKSTLLSLVCADNPQGYACDIELFGHRRGSGESIWEIKRHIGYVSPEMHRAYLKDIPALDVVASGLSNSIGLYGKAKPGQHDICRRWMKVFGIGHLAERGFLQLSSGEQRLCLLARAFVKDPELLVLDEPLHGLDETNAERVREIIEAFCQRSHKTLVMVTHYDRELPPCIDHKKRLENLKN